jgi:SAM-dependent methyltransferase
VDADLCGTPQLTTASIFNSAVAAWAISAAWEVGALDELEQHGRIDVAEFADRKQLDPPSTAGMFRALAAVDVVRRSATTVAPGWNFSEVFRTRSFFHWLMKGNAELFGEMSALLESARRTGDFYSRDSAAIAYACREINRFCYDASFWKAVDGLGFGYGSVADLGCGSGERVLQLLRWRPDARGIGLDIAQTCVDEAIAAAHRSSLQDRASFVKANVFSLPRRPEFADVDLLTCFMMGHDLWPKQQCIDTLQQIRDRFPRARRFLLGDATRSVGLADDKLPTFTLGFELAHDLMGTFIPTVTDWESVFEAGGWRLVEKYAIDVAVGETIFELAPIRTGSSRC